jgi:pimeloyl-ACP methyl ester carboxylesterase
LQHERADGSCFSKVIPPLQAEGYEVMAAQYGLDSNVEDVAATIRTLNRGRSPAILVSHSYGGAVITAAGTDDRVAGLVYICALGPDETETSQGQQDKYPKTPVFSQIDVADGRVWLKPSGIGCFCGDLPEEEQQLVYATHFAPAADLFLHNAPGVAWRTKPSWCIVANNDQAVHPDLERASAKRMGATTYDIDSSHVPMLSHPTSSSTSSAPRQEESEPARHGSRIGPKANALNPSAREAADLGSAARFILE